ncbi:MAG TPA: hypothetical protein VMO26_17590 [Vicinamibacterales bacterium]|nr:hypothetical protein [Vicinamibacterales bacterium]
MRLVSLPNIASNQADIAKNADLLTAMFEQRGFAVTRIVTPGSPLLVARRDAPNAEMLQYGGALGSLSQRSSCFRCSVIERNKTRKRTTPTCRRVPSARCSTTITSNRKSGRMKSAARTKAAQSDDGRDGE